MDSSVDISVVVATRDRARHLETMLAGLDAQTLAADRFELIVVDDGSTDETAQVLDRATRLSRTQVRWVRQETSSGPAAARNRGWRMARAPVVAFTDDDCVPTPPWLEVLLAAGATGPQTIVQGRTLPNPDELGALGPYAKTVRIEQASPHFETCNIAYPRDLLEAVGGFDERYPAPAGEDGDLGWRAQAVGGTAHFAPDALVHHAVHPGTPISALKGALLATHGVQFYKRHPELRSTLAGGVFYDRSHPLLLQAGLALWLARRQPAVGAFCLPYALNIRSRCRATGAGLTGGAFFIAYDVAQLAATLRGAARHRVPII